MRRIGLTGCPYCGRADELYSSRSQSWRDGWCVALCLRVVRCHSCMRRHYRPAFLPVPPWSQPKPVEAVVNEEKQQRPA